MSKKNISIIILLLLPFNLTANDSIPSSNSSSTLAQEWKVAKAVAIQQQSQLDELNLNTKQLSVQEVENKRNKWFQAQTGEGLPAHSEKTQEDIQQEVIQGLIANIRTNAKQIAVHSNKPLYEIVNKLHNNMKIISKSSNKKSVQIATMNGAQVKGGGEVYIYDSKTSAYLGYAKINNNSRVVLPIIEKQLLDLVIIPEAPLPLQVIQGVTPFSMDKILIADGVNILINLENQGRKLTSTTTDLYLQLETKYGVFDQFVGAIIGSGSVLIASSESYRLDIIPRTQYVTQHLKNLTNKVRLCEARATI